MEGFETAEGIVRLVQDELVSSADAATLIGQYAYRYSKEIRKDRDYWKGKIEALRADLDTIIEGASRG